MKILLRFEVDACLHNGVRKKTPSRLEAIPSRATNVNNLSYPFSPSASSKARDGPKANSTSNSSIKVVSAGELVEQSSIIELKTQSYKTDKTSRRSVDWCEHFPQLFFSQTPHHYLGVHEGGNVIRIEHHLLDSSLLDEHQAIDSDNSARPSGGAKLLKSRQHLQQQSFDKLRALLQVIHDLVVAEGSSARLSLVCLSRNMHVFKRISSANALPRAWMHRLNNVPLNQKKARPAKRKR